MPLFEFRPKSLNLDLPPSEVSNDEYTGGFNVQFWDGFARRSDGWSAYLAACPIIPQFLINATYQNNNYWIACGEDGIAYSDTTVWTDVTPVGFNNATALNQWTGGLLNGIPVFNLGNDLNPPMYFDWATFSVLTLPGWDANWTCKALRPFKFHLIAMAMTESSVQFPGKIRFSSAAAPGAVPSSWTPAANNDAGDLILSASPDPIIDGVQMRGQFMVFKANSSYLINYVGGTFVFSQRQLFSNTGLLARNCAVEYEGKVYFIADGDIYVSDGQAIQSIVDRRAQSYVFKQISPDYLYYSFAVVNRAQSEVLFCFPSRLAELPDLALSYDVLGGLIGLREIGNAAHIRSGFVTDSTQVLDWDGDSQAWNDDNTIWNSVEFNTSEDGLVVADPVTQQLWYLDSSIAQDSSPISFELIKEKFDLDTPAQYKTIKRIWPRITADGDTPISVSAGACASPDRSTVWSAPVEFIPTTGYVSTFATGRYLAVKFESEGGETFQVDGFDIEVEPEGQF